MKYFFSFIIYLYICTHFGGYVSAQNLTLIIKTENDVSKTFLDSLQLKNRFKNFVSLDAEVDSLGIHFQRMGFIDSHLLELKKENDSVFLAHYFLGNRWKQVKINYNEGDFTISDLKKVSINLDDTTFTVPISKIEAALTFLSQLKAERGDPFSKVQLDSIKKIDPQTLQAQLKVFKNAPRTLNGILIKGYDKFPKSFLKYYAGIKKNKLFNLKDIIEKSNSLNYLGFVTTVKPPEGLFKKDSTIVYLYLEKTSNNLFDGILGFATNEDSQKLVFNGYLNLELNNNLNFGEQLSINYKADGREQQNLRVFTKLPYLFKSPLGISLELEIFKRDTTFSTTHQQARLYYQANPTIDFHIGYKSYESNNLLNQNIAGTFIEDFDSQYFLSGIHYSKLQNEILTPVKTSLGLESEIGSRTTMTKKVNQIRLTGMASHIFSLNEKNSVYLKSQTHFLNSPNYLTNELFRFGGINSLRGFQENSIDASLFSVLNTEYRYVLDPTAYIHSIIDVGYFENKVLQLQEDLYGFGFGMALKTKAGIFKLNLANGISKNQNIEINNTKIHISLISNF